MLRRPGANRRGLRGFGARAAAAAPRLDFSGVPNLLVWADAQDVDVGTGLAALTDKGSAALAWAQAQASMQPSVVESASFGGRKVLSGDGGDVLDATSAGITLGEAGRLTWIVCGRMTATALRSVISTQYDGSTAGCVVEPRVGGASRSRWHDGTTALIHTGGGLTINVPFLLRAQFVGAAAPSNDSAQHFLAGTSTGAATTANLSSPILSGSKTWSLLARTSAALDGFPGEIAYVLGISGTVDAATFTDIAARTNEWFGTSFAGA